jgi:hypothetical protein
MLVVFVTNRNKSSSALGNKISSPSLYRLAILGKPIGQEFPRRSSDLFRTLSSIANDKPFTNRAPSEAINTASFATSLGKPMHFIGYNAPSDFLLTGARSNPASEVWLDIAPGSIAPTRI